LFFSFLFSHFSFLASLFSVRFSLSLCCSLCLLLLKLLLGLSFDRALLGKRNHSTTNSDAGARYIGEFALGFHPHIRQPMRDILFDEKIAGSFHFTPGQAYEIADNGNRSQVHWDMVSIQRKDWGGGEIRFDGKLIRKDGVFLPKELAKLNF
jgi:hypothetical protein